MSASKLFQLKRVCLFVVMVKWASANSDQDALSALRQALNDPDNVLSSWDSSLVDPCTWFHVKCDSNNRVVRVDLGDNNLSGHLVPDLGNLEFLQYLELYKNNIEGTIPGELGKLKNLIALDLYNNNLSGPLPSELGNLRSLTFMRINDNKLTGQVPYEISSLPNLQVLDLSNNQFGGLVPQLPPNNLKNNPLNRKTLN